MMRQLVAVALLALLLPGCAQPKASPDEAADDPAAFDDVVVTSTTGAIRGLVVSEAIVPIEGALVQLAGGPNQTSDGDGAFVFSGLQPGDHFLTVSKPGYFAVQASAVVVAGDEEPPITKVQLVVDAANQPFSELLQWTGFFGCGLAGGGLGVNPCAVDAVLCSETAICLLNTANTHDFPFGGGRIPDHAQAEMVWEGSQPLGNYLNIGWFDEGISDFKGASGVSPLVVPASRSEIVDAHDEDITSLLVRVFPGQSDTLTVTLQQRFDVYVTYFYGFAPRADWAFVNEGVCLAPEDCA